MLTMKHTYSGPRHQLTFKIMTNSDTEDKERTIEVYATPEEVAQLDTEGYIVREALFAGQSLERLRTALDEVEAAERTEKSISTSRRFGRDVFAPPL